MKGCLKFMKECDAASEQVVRGFEKELMRVKRLENEQHTFGNIRNNEQVNIWQHK